MEKLKRSFSLRKKKTPRLESSKPHQWQEDERKVREGSCSFQVKYLGCVEVFESRGIQICEEAVKVLKAKKSRSAWSRLSLRRKKDDTQQFKSGHHRAILYVTGDALRVVDEISKGLIVDQTIEKVSFCAPDRNHERGFAYICRDGTTRRWMCHGFFAIKESGERLSHAVGCAFAICLEKKQQREKDKVSVTFNENGTSFTRMGSFRQTTLTERLTDPQSAIVAEPVPFKQTELPFAVQRPHAPADILDRQGSFRGFNKLAESSPFKRNTSTSLRLSELPSTKDRQKQFAGIDGPQLTNGFGGTKASVISTIMEDEELPPSMLEETGAGGGGGVPWPVDGLTALRLDSDPSKQSTAAPSFVLPAPPQASPAQLQLNTSAPSHSLARLERVQIGNSQSATSVQLGAVVKQTNPWASSATQSSETNRPSDAENWLNSTASRIDPFARAPAGSVGTTRLRPVNGFGTGFSAPAPTGSFQTPPISLSSTGHPYPLATGSYPAATVSAVGTTPFAASVNPQFQPHLVPSWPVGGASAVHQTGHMAPPSSSLSTSAIPSTTTAAIDPFDSAWAARAASSRGANPFQPATVPTATFQVKI